MYNITNPPKDVGYPQELGKRTPEQDEEIYNNMLRMIIGIPPVYKQIASNQCPRCGTFGFNGIYCSECGYKAPVKKPIKK